jgi:hypothetical protein
MKQMQSGGIIKCCIHPVWTERVRSRNMNIAKDWFVSENQLRRLMKEVQFSCAHVRVIIIPRANFCVSELLWWNFWSDCENELTWIDLNWIEFGSIRFNSTKIEMEIEIEIENEIENENEIVETLHCDWLEWEQDDTVHWHKQERCESAHRRLQRWKWKKNQFVVVLVFGSYTTNVFLVRALTFVAELAQTRILNKQTSRYLWTTSPLFNEIGLPR